jgi:hypothetical protein
MVIGICLDSVEESPFYRNRAMVLGLGIVSLFFPFLFSLTAIASYFLRLFLTGGI